MFFFCSNLTVKWPAYIFEWHIGLLKEICSFVHEKFLENNYIYIIIIMSATSLGHTDTRNYKAYSHMVLNLFHYEHIACVVYLFFS